ncbi:MAG: class I SAM-dependent methyltransferase [Gemmatimonadaceae bacterium]|nr:class I SAM-dependent methyltransferase [Gemmatimonadaceae bacterium]
MPDEREARLEASWTDNAAAWTTVVRDDRIPSRAAGTNAAVVAAVRALAPRRLLDVGCGEGWLVRAVAADGIDAVGIDISPPLIAAAQAAGGGRFLVMRYDELHARADELGGRFDLVVCNFALLGESLVPMLAALRAATTATGTLLIQTVHPWMARGDAPYADGWRTETFAGFGDTFATSMPWYYRTLGTWIGELRASGWTLATLTEPLHPESGLPLSLLLTAHPGPTTPR